MHGTSRKGKVYCRVLMVARCAMKMIVHRPFRDLMMMIVFDRHRHQNNDDHHSSSSSSSSSSEESIVIISASTFGFLVGGAKLNLIKKKNKAKH